MTAPDDVGSPNITLDRRAPSRHDNPPSTRNVAIDYNAAMGYMSTVRDISYTRQAIRALRKMPADMAQRIISKIEQYADDPASQANNVKSLKGREGVRLRIGDWRVIMNDEGVVLAVLEIGRPRQLVRMKEMTTWAK